MKKLLLLILIIVVAFLFFISMNQVHLSPVNAIPWDVKEKVTSKTENGTAILFENTKNQTFGLALLEKRYGFLYEYYIGTEGNILNADMPFKASGLADNNQFIVGIKTAIDSGIKYISLGNHLDAVTPEDNYQLTLNDVKANQDQYYVEEVKDHYALFVINEYTEDTWTIRCFDKNGKLVADKLFGWEERYVNKGKDI